GISLATDGTLYINSVNRIRRITPDGIITNVAGTGQPGVSADGVDAATALMSPTAIKVAQDGSVYIADSRRIRQIGLAGTLATAAGCQGSCTPSPGADLVPALAWPFTGDPDAFAVGTDGSIAIANGISDGGALFRIVGGRPDLSQASYAIPSR